MKEKLYKLKDRGFQPDNILDIGAHVGDMTLVLKEVWPYADLLSVDANPYVEEVLKQKGLNYIIKTFSNSVGQEKDFWVSTEWLLSSGNSLYREKTPSFSDEKCKTIKVTTDTLDNYFKNGEKFDFIKIDTQGSELDILSGGKTLIKNAQYILSEVPIHEYNDGAYTFDQMFSFMMEQGFVIDDIFDSHYNNKGILMQIDILFKRKE